MIVRVFRVVAHHGKETEFGEFFHKTAIPLVRRQPGVVSVTAGRPRPETPTEFCMVMVWETVEALRAFAGENWREAHVHPDEEKLVKERSLHHYELVEADG